MNQVKLWAKSYVRLLTKNFDVRISVFLHNVNQRISVFLWTDAFQYFYTMWTDLHIEGLHIAIRTYTHTILPRLLISFLYGMV